MAVRERGGARAARVKPAKSVLLVSNPRLLAAGLQRLLEQLEGTELAIVAADDPRYWAAEISRRAPDAIVIDADDLARERSMVDRILEKHLSSRVVAVNLVRTTVDVQRSGRVLETGVEGLLGWMREVMVEEGGSSGRLSDSDDKRSAA